MCSVLHVRCCLPASFSIFDSDVLVSVQALADAFDSRRRSSVSSESSIEELQLVRREARPKPKVTAKQRQQAEKQAAETALHALEASDVVITGPPA